MTRAPIAIGGVGGSGTRVVAAILRDAGIDIGSDLNSSLDNLWFTLLFKQREIWSVSDAEFNWRASILQAAMAGGRRPLPQDYTTIGKLAEKDRPQHTATWLQARADTLRSELEAKKEPRTWGWKEPNTHIVVDRLAATIADLRYVHVARNGLDMAVGQNQNQLRFWGKLALGDDDAVTPRRSLKYWCWAHRRVLHVGQCLKDRFLFLKFEDLCANPNTEIRTLLTFAGAPLKEDSVCRAASLVDPPTSIGRHKSYPLDVFDAEDVAFVRELGFAVGH